MVVFAVWEPMLPTDWEAPGTSVLGRLSDRRVRQFWDPNHMVAAVLKKEEQARKLHPNCCERKGYLWDLTAAYAPQTHWGDSLPLPLLFNGPVVKVSPELESILSNAKQ